MCEREAQAQTLDHNLATEDYIRDIIDADIDLTTPVDDGSVDEAELEFFTRVRANLESYRGADDFRKSLIDYIVKEARLLTCHKVSTWQNFSNKSTYKSEKFTSARLRDFFVHSIMPQVYAFEMPEAQKRKFDILRFNDGFERIPKGYKVKAAVAYMPLYYDVDYALLKVSDINKESVAETEVTAAQEPPEKFVFETRRSDPLAPHFFVVTGAGDAPQEARPTPQTQLSAENRALLSAVVSTDYELYHSTCFERHEILARLRSSRALFQQSGRHSIILQPERLKQKVKQMTDLKNCTAELMRKRFF